MRYIVTALLLFVNSFLFGQNPTEVSALLDQKKYDTAFKNLDEKDPDNKDPEVVLQKIDIALSYFIQSITHQLFAFKNIEEGEDLFELRSAMEEQSLSMYMFPINEVLDTLILQHPNNFKLHEALGDYYYTVHLIYGQNWIMDEQEVLKHMFDNCLKASQNGIEDYQNEYCIAYYHTLNEAYQDAIPYYLKSIEYDTKYPTSHYNLAICYMYVGELLNGAEHAVKSIDLYEDDYYKSDAARLAGTLYEESNDLENALKYYQLANQIQEENYYTLSGLLGVEVRLDKTNAKQTANALFELAPTNPSICSRISDIYTHSEKGTELLAFYDQKIEEYQSNNEVLGNIYFHIGSYYQFLENNEESKKAFKIARSNFEKVLDKEHEVFKIIEEALK